MNSPQLTPIANVIIRLHYNYILSYIDLIVELFSQFCLTQQVDKTTTFINYLAHFHPKFTYFLTDNLLQINISLKNHFSVRI